MTEPSQTTNSGSTLVTSHTPTGTQDDAPGSPDNNQNDNNNNVPGGMASYYFVFLMLTLCVIGVVVFLNFRRRRKRRLQLLHGRVDAFQSDPNAARGRRYWHTRWGSTNVSREEGLNEHGEAPPPYMPKRPSQEVQRAEGAQATDGGPAVPMQTLSRDQAGLKPPDYEEAGGQDDMMRPSQRPGAGGSSSQRQDV